MAPAGMVSTSEAGGGATVLEGTELVVVDDGTVGSPLVVEDAVDEVDEVDGDPVVVGGLVAGVAESDLHDASSAAAAAAAPCWSRRRRVNGFMAGPRRSPSSPGPRGWRCGSGRRTGR